MMLTFRVLGYANALSWLLILNGEHVTGSFPLPNPVESPHIKNQSLFSCLSTYDPTLMIKATPYKPTSCQTPILVTASITLQEDVLSLACYGKVYLNGDLLVSDSATDLCVKVKELKCPLLKGELQKSHATFRMPCALSKGYYKAMGYCKNQDNKTVVCMEWDVLWE